MSDPTERCWCCGAEAVPDRFYDGAYCERCWDQVCSANVHLREERNAAKAEVELLRDSAPKEWAIRVDNERRALEAEIDRLKADNAAILLAKVTGSAERQLSEARLVARHLWRLPGVRGQWDPPEKYGLDWLTSEKQP